MPRTRYRRWCGAMLLASAAIALTSSACGRRSAAAAPALLNTALADQLRAQQGWPWAATRPLSWQDFAGPAPPASQEAAHTAYALLYGISCRRDVFSFDVVAAFLPARSGVAPEVRDSLEAGLRTLRHEQTHFDLGEVSARRMRKFFRDLYAPCIRTEAELGALADRFIAEDRDIQRRYDEDTRNGRNAERQQAWDRDTAAQLQALQPFAR